MTEFRGWTATGAVALAACLLAGAGPAVALEEVAGFGANPGQLKMYLHRPAAARPGLPLVVALHGCLQNARDFAEETGLLALSEEVPFVLVLPEQQQGNVDNLCFRWFDSEHNRPGLGESASIRAMIDQAIATEAVDPDAVHVLGLSAGGAMAAVMLADYPDLFAGGAVIAGVPYGCNRPAGIFDSLWYWYHYNRFLPAGSDGAYACGIAGFGHGERSAGDWAGYVREAAGPAPAHWPRVSLWQGTADDVVDPDNLGELVEQWTAAQGIDAVAEDSATVDGALHEVYRDDAGVARVESWTLPGFGHAVPIDADGDPEPCGRPGDYIENANLCAVRRIAEFWQLGGAAAPGP